MTLIWGSDPVGFASDELTCDGFLGGKLQIWQPKTGYRAGADPVFLAAATDARAGQTVLELGCGVGVVSLCLAHRVPGLSLTGVEVQEKYAELARRNAAENGVGLSVVTADLTKLPATLRAKSFDFVVANPPYLQRQHGSVARDGGRDIALAGATPLSDWVDIATRRLTPGGQLIVIQKASRLPDLLAAIKGPLGSITVKPLSPRAGRDSSLTIVAATKNARADFRLLNPMILHEGTRHTTDGDSYTSTAKAILRDGMPLNFAD